MAASKNLELACLQFEEEWKSYRQLAASLKLAKDVEQGYFLEESRCVY
jgi:hypothetical protein